MIQGAAFRVLACFHDQDVRSFTDICERAGYPTDLGGYYLRPLTSLLLYKRVPASKSMCITLRLHIFKQI